MIDIKIINNMVCELRSPKNIDFVKSVCRPMSGKWNTRKGVWAFDASDKDKLIDGCKTYFPDARITLSEIEKPVLDRASETKRKIIAGSLLLKRYEDNAPDDQEFIAWFDEKIELMRPGDKIMFGYKTQTKPWRYATSEPKVNTVEV